MTFNKILQQRKKNHGLRVPIVISGGPTEREKKIQAYRGQHQDHSGYGYELCWWLAGLWLGTQQCGTVVGAKETQDSTSKTTMSYYGGGGQRRTDNAF